MDGALQQRESDLRHDFYVSTQQGHEEEEEQDSDGDEDDDSHKVSWVSCNKCKEWYHIGALGACVTAS